MRSHAYFAGFFDGDGCMRRNGPRGRQVQLNVKGCHLPVLLAFREMYGGSVTYDRYLSERPSCKPQYEWASHGPSEAILREWLKVDTSSPEYLAGYFDAEGSVKRSRKQAQMVAGGYDPRTSLILRETFGGSVIANVSDKGYRVAAKPAYIWYTHVSATQHTLETLEPLMIEKRAQAQVALRYYAGEITIEQMDEQLRELKKVAFPIEDWKHVIDGKHGTRGDTNDDTGIRHRSGWVTSRTDDGLAIDHRGGGQWDLDL